MPPLSESVVIRSWPKMIFSWPSALAALAAGYIVETSPELQQTAGVMFLTVFAANFCILAFEFTRGVSLLMFLSAVTAAVSAILLNQHFALVMPLKTFFLSTPFTATAEFFFALAAIHIGALALLFVISRFDYWKLSANELVHVRSVFGDQQRFSTNGLKVNKEVHDVFEYLIGGAGRLVFTVPGNNPIVLENVLGIRGIERAADRLLDARVVRVESA